MRLITIILSTVLMFLSTMSEAQNTMTYSYDASGNRISRQITVSSVKERPGETSDISDQNDINKFIDAENRFLKVTLGYKFTL